MSRGAGRQLRGTLNPSWRGDAEEPSTSLYFVNDEYSFQPASDEDSQYLQTKFKYNGGKGHFRRRFQTV
jgi:hypothetical protein